MLDPDKIPRKIMPKKCMYKGKRECIMLAIQPMMHTAYIKFTDTNKICVAPLRLLHRKIAQPNKLIDYMDEL